MDLVWEQRKVAEITKFHKQGFYTTEDYNENKKYYAIFLRIVAKCVKVPFHVQHFEGESLEYLV